MNFPKHYHHRSKICAQDHPLDESNEVGSLFKSTNKRRREMTSEQRTEESQESKDNLTKKRARTSVSGKSSKANVICYHSQRHQKGASIHSDVTKPTLLQDSSKLTTMEKAGVGREPLSPALSTDSANCYISQINAMGKVETGKLSTPAQHIATYRKLETVHKNPQVDLNLPEAGPHAFHLVGSEYIREIDNSAVDLPANIEVLKCSGDISTESNSFNRTRVTFNPIVQYEPGSSQALLPTSRDNMASCHLYVVRLLLNQLMIS